MPVLAAGSGSGPPPTCDEAADDGDGKRDAECGELVEGLAACRPANARLHRRQARLDVDQLGGVSERRARREQRVQAAQRKQVCRGTGRTGCTEGTGLYGNRAYRLHRGDRSIGEQGVQAAQSGRVCRGTGRTGCTEGTGL